MGVTLYEIGQNYSNANGVYRYDGKDENGQDKFTKISNPVRGTPNVVNGVIKGVLTDQLGNAMQAIPPVDPEAYQKVGADALQGLQQGLGGLMQQGLAKVGPGLEALGGSLGSIIPGGGGSAPLGPAVMPGYNPADFYTGAMAPPNRTGSGTLVPSSNTPPPTDLAAFYTGGMAPPTSANGKLYQSGVPIPPATGGLTTRKVSTVPIDPTTGLPILTSAPPQSVPGDVFSNQTPGAYGNNPMASQQPAPPASVIPQVPAVTTTTAQTAPTPEPARLLPTPALPLGYDSDALAAQPQRTYGLPYSGSGAASSIYGDQAYVDKTTFIDPLLTPPGALPQSTVPTGTTQVADAGIIPPVPFPYPLKPDTTQPPLEITNGGMGTQPPAVATQTDTAPVAPPPSQASFQPGMMNRAPVPSPMVTLASGKLVPAGTQGSAQGGRYSYTVLPDGSVFNTTTNRITAPGSVYDRGPMPSTPPPSSASLLQGIQDVWNKTPMGHVSQYLSGQKPEGGLLSLVPGMKTSKSGQPANNGIGTYWNGHEWVGGGQ